MSFIVLFPSNFRGKEFPDTYPRFIPLFTVSAQLFFLSVEFMSLLNYLQTRTVGSKESAFPVRPGYMFDICRCIESLLVIWDKHIHFTQQHKASMVSDDYMYMFHDDSSSFPQPIIGGHHQTIPSNKILDSLQSISTTNITFEVLSSFLMEDDSKFITTYIQHNITH